MNQESPRTLVLFNYDWDRLGFGRWSAEFPHDHAGFDLFRFGRFPHRNAVLGRATTAQEQAFLDEGGFAG